MKAVIDLMNKKYQGRSCDFHKIQSFCHSMNVQDYKIHCKEFFLNQQNEKLELEIAQQATSSLQDQDIFEKWLIEE